MNITLRAALLGIVFLLSSLPAEDAVAARRPYLFTWDTETLTRGGLEIEQWLWAKVNPPAGAESAAWIWFAPVYGVSRSLEIAFPWELVSTASKTTLTNFTLDLRYRLTDALDQTRFTHWMVRGFYQFNVNHPLNAGRLGKPWVGANLVGSFGSVAGTHATLDVGYFGDVNVAAGELQYQTLGVGITKTLTDEVRGSLEYYHELSLGSVSQGTQRFFAGPTLAFSRGNVWLNFGTLFGLTAQTPSFFPRFMFGVSL